MKAAIYARQSSGSDDFSDSVEQQVANCRELAKREKFTILGEFSDLNTSGKTYPEGAELVASMDMAFCQWFATQSSDKKFRPGFGRICAMLDRIDLILVDDLTRLYRPLSQSYLEPYIHQKLEKYGVKVLAVKGGSLDPNSFNDALINTLLARINDPQISIQRKKSMDALRKLRDSGRLVNGGSMFGLRRLPEDKLGFDPVCAQIVRLIYREAKRGTPYLQIARQINRDFSQTFKKYCYLSTIYSVLSQPIYCGFMYNSNRELIKNQQISGNEIITLEEWREIQDIVASKKTHKVERKSHWLPFSGKLLCGNCGSKLVMSVDRGRIFYSCRNRSLTGNESCAGSRIIFRSNSLKYSGLYEAVAPLLFLHTYMDRARDEAKDLTTDRNKRRRDIARIDEKEKLILGLFDQGLVSATNLNTSLQGYKKQREQFNEPAGCDGDRLLSGHFDETDMLRSRNPELMWSNDEYQTRLNAVLQSITVHTDRIEVALAAGGFTLARDIRGAKRHLPAVKTRIYASKDSDSNKKIVVTYHYGESGIKRYKLFTCNDLTVLSTRIYPKVIRKTK